MCVSERPLSRAFAVLIAELYDTFNEQSMACNRSIFIFVSWKESLKTSLYRNYTAGTGSSGSLSVCELPEFKLSQKYHLKLFSASSNIFLKYD